MTEPVNDAPVANGAEGDVGIQNQEAEKFNPAWNPLLEKIPDKNLQQLIMPELKQWDQNYQQGIQKVHSQYAPFKPFLDAKVDPEELNRAMLVYQALNENPEQVIEGLIEFYQYGGEQGQDDDPEADPEYDEGDEDASFDITQHPEFQRYGQMTETMAQALLQQHEAQLEAQEDAALDQELAAAREKLGDFDEDYVLQQMHFHDLSAEEAVQKYQQFVQNTVQNYRSPGSQAPILAGGSGGLPSQQTPVRNLSGQDRRKLMVEALARAHQGG